MARKQPAKTASKKAPELATEERKTITTAEIEEQEKRMGGMPKGADIVFVGLNRPTGILYTLKSGKRVLIGGNAVHLCKLNEARPLPMPGAYGITPVERADWEEIKATYGNTAIFKSGRIFANDTQSSALAQAKDNKDTRHGLEPAKPSGTTKPGAKKAGA